ncbi:MAG TPA: RHS repeat-associated core domain-containing protein, partial [Bacteroidales bacterium]|nr:RHS repeat-associated core domain-containing protein [Bacteroidales bacterium]
MLEAGIGCFNQKYLKAFKCVALVGPDRNAHTFRIILYFSRDLGKKMYELSNHLGNVLTTVSDIKLTADGNTDGVVDSYAAVITSAQDYYTKLKLQLVQRRTAISYLDNAVETCCSALQFGLKYKSTRYYPFGSLEPGRTYSSDNYRFGFNGQEMDNEISGQTGTHTTAMFWEYDSRLGRRWNVDPLSKLAAGWSPYRAFFCNPILYSDPFGLFETRKEARQYRRENGLRGKIN